jgi:XTP/dITP diphosphohydrolase
MKTLWLATGNLHKLEEVKTILGRDYNLKSLKDLPKPMEIEENGNSYLENAEIKARAVFEIVNQPVFADASGLEVDALNGEPGIHSARFSGPETNHERNIAKLLKTLEGVPREKRTARFRCIIVYIDETGASTNFEGIFPGYIGFKKSGSGGFGYDPVFYLEHNDRSVAQIPPDEKNRISHRGLAVAKLKQHLDKQQAGQFNQ